MLKQKGNDSINSKNESLLFVYVRPAKEVNLKCSSTLNWATWTKLKMA